MKLIYLTVDGLSRIENWKMNARRVQEPDGDHPVTNDSVWQHSRRMFPPAMVIIQGVLGPYGADMTREDVLGILYEQKVAEKAFLRSGTSKMWMRWLSNAGSWLMTYGALLFVALLAIGAALNQFLGA